MVLVVLGWVRFYKEDENAHPLRRIVKNSVTPMFAQLAGKVIDFGFAFISLRLLGPEGNGRYTFAVTTWLFFNTISDFGLETLVTREVARNRTTENSNRYFSTMLVTRLTLAAISLPAALVWVGGFSLSGSIAPEVVWAIALLMIGMLPSAVSGTMSAVFRGYEKFEYLAALQILGSILKVPLGLGALLLGWNVIGLAGTSIVVNVVAMSILLSIFQRELFPPEVRQGFDRSLVKPMLSAAFPLMLNGLLISIMFKSDVFLLQPFKGDNEVGLYNAAYKFVDALLIFPSAITMALFPLFSSYSANARENMTRAFAEGMRLLAIVGLPICGGMVFVAYDLIGLLGGESFLPGGAIALQILIWFLPFSYINGITQYVLIALNRQRYITVAVLITAACNIILNLIFIPFFGYIAASAMTIATEVILLIIYAIIMRRINEPFPVLQAMLRPTAATAAMVAVLFGVTVGLHINNFFVTVILGIIVYLAGVVVFRAVTKEDMRYIRKILKR
jgi:O-antigen/teichoic acid export membrane protein